MATIRVFDTGISGIWFTNTQISFVMLHTYSRTTGKWSVGVKTSKSEVVRSLRQGINIATILWNHQTLDWKIGAKVIAETNGNIKTDPDNSTADNLDNLIDMKYFSV